MAEDTGYTEQFHVVEDGKQHLFPRSDQHVTIYCGKTPIFGAEDKNQLALGYIRWREENGIENNIFGAARI
jgi:hypothetical protein